MEPSGNKLTTNSLSNGKAYPSASSRGMSNSSSEDSDNDVEAGAINNLLDIRGGISHWDSLGQQNPNARLGSGLMHEGALGIQPIDDDDDDDDDEEANAMKSVSTSKFYEPKFIEVYKKYSEGRSIDLSAHLMIVCLEHLAPFCIWARENPTRCAWIRSILDDNADLRPEVRNGLAMVLIYVFSAAKAALFSQSDMFTTLREPDTGLGIVNKTSLKIYNDPYNYYNFLKACISGLIDAGYVPENERQNQPKKSKKITEIKEELNAYNTIKQTLVAYLLRGEMLTVRSKVQVMLNAWQPKNKALRSKRFVTALGLLQSNTFPIPNQYPYAYPNVVGIEMYGKRGRESMTTLSMVPMENPKAGMMVSMGFDDEKSPIVTPGVSQILVPSDTQNKLPSPPRAIDNPMTSSAREERPAKQSRISSNSSGEKLHRAVCGMRFDKVGNKEWQLKEARIFDLASLLSSTTTTIYLIDESKLTKSEMETKQLVSSTGGFNTLQSELLHRKAMVTSWPRSDYSQLRGFLEKWSADDSNASLSSFWLGDTTSVSSSSGSMFKGLLAYESISQVGLVLRACPKLSLDDDCWRLLYPKDLQGEALTMSLGSFLSSLFPQTKYLFETDLVLDRVIVKYFPHGDTINPPSMEKKEIYQTIGTLGEQASLVLSRLDSNASFHDLVLNVI